MPAATKSPVAHLVLIDQIYPDPVKLRAVDPEHVAEIKQSFETKGQQQPIRIRPTSTGYSVVFGEHRLQAARELNVSGKTIKRVPMGYISAIVEQVDEYESLELKITENAHRNSFVDPWEEGKVLKKLLFEKYDGAVDGLARSLSKTTQYIKDRTRVYDCLDPSLRQYIGTKGGLSIANTITLAKYDDRSVQVALANRIIDSKNIQKKFQQYTGGGGGGGRSGSMESGWLAPKPKVELECVCSVCGNMHRRPSFSVPIEPEIPDIPLEGDR